MNETKFNQKGSVYAKGRPGYPDAVFEYLRSSGVIDKCKTVADFGSGTGIFSLQISQFADIVYAIEPNDDMRQIAEREFCNYSNIVSVNATAENSLLADKSVDLITVAIERNLSSSYAPMKQDVQYTEYVEALEVIFEKNQDNGELYYPYITRCYIGTVSSNS